MASTAGDLRNREIKLLKADGPQFVQRNDKLQGTKAVEPNNATSPHEVEVPSLDRLDLNENSNGAIEDFSDGTKAVEPNNATSPHEVEVPSLDRLDLNENSNGAIEDFSDGAWLRKLLYSEGKRRGTMKWKRLLPSSDLSSLRESLIDPPGEAV
ncbi:uncharacterized protein LOC112182344 isoform X2 [Rosa chinensis]|uniref:uncharacterized protein LOC112182344 isoform X2 n=1 Tax=Rosa chinensis TaxID=74649 RepID=UPI001AD8E4D3|nr:uncharacterized protein LOC112182344 isoform X2 [Rosa chinensis]